MMQLLRLTACTVTLAAAACIPVEDGLGTLTPIPPGGQPPDFNVNTNADADTDAQFLRFDVQISAQSNAVSGVNIAGLVVIELDENSTLRAITISDTLSGALQENPLSGRLFLTTADTTGLILGGTFFDLTVTQSGGVIESVAAEFAGSNIGSVNPNGFVLQADGLFEPGRLGVSYELVTPSRFTLVLDGRSISGELDLAGIPTNAAGQPEHYEGTFTGTQRP